MSQYTTKTTIEIKREEATEFLGAIGDKNIIHRDIEIAKERGFEDTPVVGTYVTALASDIKRVLKRARREDKKLKIIREKATLREMAFPGTKFNLEEIITIQDGKGSAKITSERNGIKAIQIDLTFSREYPEQPKQKSELPVYEKEIILTPEKSRWYSRCLGLPITRKVSPLHVSRFVPGVVEEFQRKLAEIKGTEPTGINRGTDTTFFRKKAKIGKAFVQVYFVGERKVQDGYLYQFDCLITQKNRAVTETRLNCFSTEPANIYALQKPKA